MSCLCVNAKPLPNCFTSLLIGVAAVNTDYNVCFRTPTGRIDVYPVTSDVSTGEVIIEDAYFRIGDIYEMWLVPQDGNINDLQSFTVGGESVLCVNVEFQYTNASFGAIEIELV